MKTIFIYNQGIEVPLQFFVKEGDYRELHGTFINISDDERIDELNKILDYDDNGKPAVEMLDVFPIEQITDKETIFVIEVGFLP